MKFGANTWIWFAPVTLADLKAIAPRLAAAGFDMIELPLEQVNGFDYPEAAAVIKDHGLGVSTCAAMGPDRDLVHPDQTIQDNGKAYIRHTIEATQTLGGTNLVGPIYSAVGRTWKATAEERARDTALLVEQLQELGAYAADHGVVLGIEPINRFETSFINLAAQVIEVVDRVDSPGCKIMLDTFHMNIEEKSLGEAIRAAGPRLVHLHACENDRGAPGNGHVPWADVAQALKEINYAGPVVIESFTAQVESIARAAAIWRAMEPSQDDIAFKGLKFLKQLLATPIDA
ncbi:MAG TPA: sugar phosphate isomerase/epimerase family protein [Anaerolineae bacterium]|nr:sugar phosphate isomerase/epimerase family protein [Anaerolineae bacterium]